MDPLQPPIPAQPAGLLGLMDSLSDPIRLRLLTLLQAHELSVLDLCTILQLPQSTISRHLKILADQDWLRARRLGTANLYSMREDELPAGARKLWSLTREQTTDWATLRQDALRLKRLLEHKAIEGPESFFAGAAADWDKVRSELYGQSFSMTALLALLPPGMTVADIGCGSAPLAPVLSPHVKQIIAVDNSPAMLKAARKRTEHLPNVDLRKGDFHALPIDSASVDAALMVLSLTYSPDPSRAIAEIARILKPAGGRAVLVDLLPHDRDDFRRQLSHLHAGFSVEEVTTFFTTAGLADPQVTPLPPEPAAKGPALFLATATKA